MIKIFNRNAIPVFELDIQNRTSSFCQWGPQSGIATELSRIRIRSLYREDFDNRLVITRPTSQGMTASLEEYRMYAKAVRHRFHEKLYKHGFTLVEVQEKIDECKTSKTAALD